MPSASLGTLQASCSYEAILCSDNLGGGVAFLSLVVAVFFCY